MVQLFRRLAVLIVIAVVIVVAVRRLGSRDGSTDGVEVPKPASPEKLDEPAVPASPTASPFPATTVAPTPAEPAGPTESAEPAGPTESAEPADAVWVAAVGGACPMSHPVKVKESSGIFHVPGGANHQRTLADRCYPSAEAAEADGYRAAKR